MTDDQRRIVRLAAGTTVTVALAITLAWPLAFIAPVFVAQKLATRAGRPHLRQIANETLTIVAASLTGLLVSVAFGGYPTLCLAVVGLAMAIVFYLDTGGMNPFLSVLWLVGIVAVPLLGIQSSSLAVLLGAGLTVSGAIAFVVAWLAHAVFPDDEGTAVPVAGPITLTSSERLSVVGQRLLMVMPLVCVVFTLGLSSWLLMLIIAIILAQQTDAATGLTAGKMLLLANIGGGIVATLMYEGLVIVPTLAFLLATIALVCLIFGARIFSAAPTAPLWGSALSTVLVLIGTGTMPIGDGADVKFTIRILQMAAATGYVVAALIIVTLYRSSSSVIPTSFKTAPAEVGGSVS